MKSANLTKTFIFGFIAGLLFFFCLNVYLYFGSFCHHCVNRAGFPLIFWARFIGNASFTPESGITNNPNDFEYFIPAYLIADVLIGLLFSIGIGFIAKYIRRKVFFNRAYLK